MSSDMPSLLQLLEEKKKLSTVLISLLEQYNSIDGKSRLQNRILRELEFLRKLNETTLKEAHVKSTNLNHYQALVSQIKKQPYPQLNAFLKTVKVTLESGASKTVIIDIVCDGQLSWIKVIARNPMAMSLVSRGECQYGKRSIIDQANDFLLAAQQHKHLYQVPRVIFFFSAGIVSTLCKGLEELGIIVGGEIVVSLAEQMGQMVLGSSDSESEEMGVSQVEALPASPLVPPQSEHVVVDKVNLDVTAMIGYVSALTNGDCERVLDRCTLNEQRDQEREAPLKPVLDKLFEGKTLISCQSAVTAFQSIIDVLGGPAETQRAAELMQRVQVVPDSCEQNTLHLNNKIKVRSATVFATGELHRAITVTANEGFVRSAKNQNVSYTVFVHASRALTEKRSLLDEEPME